MPAFWRASFKFLRIYFPFLKIMLLIIYLPFFYHVHWYIPCSLVLLVQSKTAIFNSIICYIRHFNFPISIYNSYFYVIHSFAPSYPNDAVLTPLGIRQLLKYCTNNIFLLRKSIPDIIKPISARCHTQYINQQRLFLSLNFYYTCFYYG